MSWVSPLTVDQIESYNMNGYLVVPNVLTPDETYALHGEAKGVMNKILEGGPGVTQYDVASLGAQPSSIGRELATFETGE